MYIEQYRKATINIATSLVLKRIEIILRIANWNINDPGKTIVKDYVKIDDLVELKTLMIESRVWEEDFFAERLKKVVLQNLKRR